MKEFLTFVNKTLDQKDYAYEELFCFFSKQDNLPVYHYKIQKGQSFFRARKNNSFKNFSEFIDLSYPPNEFVLQYNRANKPLQSVLYVSDTWLTNHEELKRFWLKELDIGDIFWVTQAEWEILDDIKVIIIPDFQNTKMNDFIKNFVSNDNTKEQVEFLQIINKHFRTPVKPKETNSPIYKFTSAFCNSLLAESLRNNNKIDGILYTSVEHNSGFNLSLNSDLINEGKMKIKNVVKHYLRKSSKSEIDNYIDPIMAKEIDYKSSRIIWET